MAKSISEYELETALRNVIDDDDEETKGVVCLGDADECDVGAAKGISPKETSCAGGPRIEITYTADQVAQVITGEEIARERFTERWERDLTHVGLITVDNPRGNPTHNPTTNPDDGIFAPIGAKTTFIFFTTFGAPQTTSQALLPISTLHIVKRSALGCLFTSSIFPIKNFSSNKEGFSIDSTSKPILVKALLI